MKLDSSSSNPINPLEELVGEQLSAVIFVQNYVQLDFDGSRVTGHIWPEMIIDGHAFEFGDPGYRDSLCTLISSRVTEATASDQIIRIVLGESSILEFRISNFPEKEGDRVALNGRNGSWSFW